MSYGQFIIMSSTLNSSVFINTKLIKLNCQWFFFLNHSNLYFWAPNKHWNMTSILHIFNGHCIYINLFGFFYVNTVFHVLFADLPSRKKTLKVENIDRSDKSHQHVLNLGVSIGTRRLWRNTQDQFHFYKTSCNEMIYMLTNWWNDLPCFKNNKRTWLQAHILHYFDYIILVSTVYEYTCVRCGRHIIVVVYVRTALCGEIIQWPLTSVLIGGETLHWFHSRLIAKLYNISQHTFCFNHTGRCREFLELSSKLFNFNWSLYKFVSTGLTEEHLAALKSSRSFVIGQVDF